MVTTNNSVTTQGLDWGAIVVAPAPVGPVISLDMGPMNGQPIIKIQNPTQIAGLIQFNMCCTPADASAAFLYADFDAGTSVISITIGGVSYGTFNTAYTTSNATIQTAINALINAAGYTATVTGADYQHRLVTITRTTSGSGATYNGTVLLVAVTSGSATITTQHNFSGGVDANCSECRNYQIGGSNIGLDDNYSNPVFANNPCTTDPMTNDKTAWYFSYPYLTSSHLVSANAVFKLQKSDGATWNDVATLNSNTYGTYYGFNSITGHANWTGYILSWCKVLVAFGEGLYRIQINSSIYASGSSGGAGGGTDTPRVTGCLASEPYCLKTWSCYAADRTVKFETGLTGQIGDIINDGKVFKICPTTLYDSIRMEGFFGYEKTDYQELNIEYATGQIKKIRDKALQKFICKLGIGKGLPKWLLDRFKAYALMADTLQVTDCNWNNSDYLIKQKYVKKAGGFQPTYNNFTRLAKVNIDFEEAIQNVLKTTCCS